MRAPTAGIAVAGIMLLLAGCGGGSAAPGSTTGARAQLDPQQVAHLQAFAACMRAHGVAHIGAVNGNGRHDPSGSGQVNLNSPTVKAAVKTCLPIADGTVGANLRPVATTHTTEQASAHATA